MYLLFPANTASGYAIYLIPIDQTAAEVATSFGLTMAVCAEFDIDDFDTNAIYYQYCFTLINNQPLANGVDLPLLNVQEQAAILTKSSYSIDEKIALNGYTSTSLAAQAALPEVSRVAAIQAVITDVNALVVQLNTDLLAIAAATSVSQINNLLFPPAAVTFNVTNNGSGNYVINGQSNPALPLIEGYTYTFNVNAVGHPFWIKTSSSIGTDDQYNIGVTNNGTDNGVITFSVPVTGIDSTLYYNCQYHASMAGVLNISA